MTDLSEFLTAAREMRDAHGAHAKAHVHGDADYGEIAKADKAARKKFEALAADLTLAERLAALQPALEVRSAADAVCLSANHLRALLGPAVPEPDERSAIARYGAESPAMQIWFAWKAAAAFREAWPAFLALAMPVESIRATTMDYSTPAEAVPTP